MSQELHEKQLLSLFFLRFTHTPTRTRLRACARDRGERRKKPVPCMATVAACSPRLAHVGVAGRLGRNDPHAPLGATRGRTVAHATPATLAELKTSGQPVYGSFPARDYRRGTREQPPFQAEFVLWSERPQEKTHVRIAKPRTRPRAVLERSRRSRRAGFRELLLEPRLVRRDPVPVVFFQSLSSRMPP